METGYYWVFYTTEHDTKRRTNIIVSIPTEYKNSLRIMNEAIENVKPNDIIFLFDTKLKCYYAYGMIGERKIKKITRVKDKIHFKYETKQFLLDFKADNLVKVVPEKYFKGYFKPTVFFPAKKLVKYGDKVFSKLN